MNDEPTTGSPPMPTIVELPRPSCVSSWPIWYVSVPERETRPTAPSLKISAGMIPTFALPGESTPGQFGPIIVTPFGRKYVYAFSISCTGTCSVMQMTVAMPASTAS